MNKREMLRLMQEEYERLEQFLAGLSEAQMTAPLLDEGWSISGISVPAKSDFRCS